jgi:hypothetical protein
MRRTALFCAVLFLASSTAARAELVIDVGDHLFAPGETRTIPLYVSGGDAAAGLTCYVQIGDGGAFNGGVDTLPIITNLDVIGAGTIFELNNTGPVIFSTESLLWGAATVTDESVGPTVPCQGIFAYLTIDTTGALPGQSFPLLLKGVAAGIFGDPGIDTVFVDAEGNEIAASITNGSISIIPEPSTIGLLCSVLAALSVMRLRRRSVRES